MRLFKDPVDSMGYWNTALPNGSKVSMTIVGSHWRGWGLTEDHPVIAFLDGQRVPGLAANFDEMELLIIAFDMQLPTDSALLAVASHRKEFGMATLVEVHAAKLSTDEYRARRQLCGAAR